MELTKLRSMANVLLFIEASLHCDVFSCNFGISLYWMFCICINQFCFSVTFYPCKSPWSFCIPFLLNVRIFLDSLFCLFSLHSCTAPLLIVMFSLTLPLLILLVVPPCPKVVVMTLTFYGQIKDFFFYFFHPAFLSFSFKCKPTSSSYRSSSWHAAIRCN